MRSGTPVPGRPSCSSTGSPGRGPRSTPLALGIREAGFRTLTPDLLGHGASDAVPDPARHDVARQAADLAAILRARDAIPAAVVGYSLGGRIALRLALDAPGIIDALVLIGAGAGIADPTERARRRAVDEELAVIHRARWRRGVRRPMGGAPALRVGGVAPRGRPQASPGGAALAASGRPRRQRPGRGTGEAGAAPGPPRRPPRRPPSSSPARSTRSPSAAPARSPMPLGPGRTSVLVIEGAGHAAHLAAPDVVRAAIVAHLVAAIPAAHSGTPSRPGAAPQGRTR